jgi:hypothetical protein
VSPDASKVELFPINVCHHPSSSWLIYKALKETPYYPFKGYVRHVRNDNYSSRFVKSKFVCFCFVLFVCLVVFPIFFCCFCFHLLDKSNLLTTQLSKHLDSQSVFLEDVNLCCLPRYSYQIFHTM